MNNWIKEWSPKLNISKCRIVSSGRKSNIVKYDYFIGNEIRESRINNRLRSGFRSTIKIWFTYKRKC